MSAYTKMNNAVMLAAIVVAMVAIMASPAEAQGNIPSCAANLASCAVYLNATTKPPADCCNPLKEAVTKELPCLCNLYNTTGLLKSLGINVTQAVGLPKLCGIPQDQSACPGAPNSSPKAPVPPSGTPKNNVGRTTVTGIFSFVLILASMVLLLDDSFMRLIWDN